ncbi:MAG: hypothetical protein ACI90E_002139 [Yoonia sp.]|jgi:hypothetical protein
MSALIRRRAADTVTVPHARRCIHQVLRRFLCLCEVYADRAVAAFVVGDTAAPATTTPTPVVAPIVNKPTPPSICTAPAPPAFDTADPATELNPASTFKPVNDFCHWFTLVLGAPLSGPDAPAIATRRLLLSTGTLWCAAGSSVRDVIRAKAVHDPVLPKDQFAPKIGLRIVSYQVFFDKVGLSVNSVWASFRATKSFESRSLLVLPNRRCTDSENFLSYGLNRLLFVSGWKELTAVGEGMFLAMLGPVNKFN